MSPQPSTTSLILDWETLSTDPHAAVIEVACIAVDRESWHAFSSFEMRPAFLPQIASGRTINDDTIKWHQSKGTFPQVDGTIPLADCVRHLVEFIAHHNPHRIWAWGKDFERPLLEDICLQHGIAVPPFQYRQFACARDKWQDAFGMEEREPKRTHHAHQDCLDELRDLRTALTAMNLTHVF